MATLRDRARRSLAGTVHVRHGTILFGPDVLLARSAANTLDLADDDALTLAGSVTMAGGTFTYNDVTMARTSNKTMTFAGTFDTDGLVVTHANSTGWAVAPVNGQMVVGVMAGTVGMLVHIQGTSYFQALSVVV